MKWIGSLALIFIALWAGVGTLDGGFISDDFVLLHTAQHVPIVKNFTSNWLGETGPGRLLSSHCERIVEKSIIFFSVTIHGDIMEPTFCCISWSRFWLVL